LEQHAARTTVRHQALDRVQESSALVASQFLAVTVCGGEIMEESVEPTSVAESQVIALFRRLVGGLPAGGASLKIDARSQSIPDGTRVELIPSLPTAAKIAAVVLKEGVVYLTLGRATPCEFEVKNGDTPDRSPIGEIESLCKAVIDGWFEEDVWFIGSKIFKCVGKITLAGRTRTIHYRNSFHPLTRSEKQHFQYAPYVVPAA
jgi:hypothetical protein